MPSKTPRLNPYGSKATTEHKMAISFKRKASAGFDFASVDLVELLAALSVVVQSNVAIMISAAMGGRGVVLKIFAGEERAIEYATLPEELDNLLSQIVDAYASPSEDVREIIRLAVERRYRS